MPKDKTKTQILILGGGFAGYFAAKRLESTLAKRDDVEVKLVTDVDYLLFTPMLPEVAAGELEAGDIAFPFRRSLHAVQVLRAKIESIDVASQTVTVSIGKPSGTQPSSVQVLDYDHVVIALGSESKFFDDSIRQNAICMKTLGDAMKLRTRLAEMLENASVENDPKRCAALLTFVVVGGGFSGVETAGAINDYLRESLRYFPMLSPKMIRVVVAHHGKTLLPEFTEKLGHYTTTQLRKSGIDVMLDAAGTVYDGRTLVMESGELIQTDTVIWTAGVTPAAVLQSVDHPKERGRILVGTDMRSSTVTSVWAAGDAAHIPGPDGKPYPTTAQHAMREGKWLAKNLEAVIDGQGAVKPFTFTNLGQLAAIGRRKGVADVLGLHFSGLLAWLFWRTIYLIKLPSLSRKVRVALRWTVDMVFGPDPVQLSD